MSKRERESVSLCVRVSVGILSAGSSASLPCRAAAIETSTGLEAKTGANFSAALSGEESERQNQPNCCLDTPQDRGGGDQTDLLPCFAPP